MWELVEAQRIRLGVLYTWHRLTKATKETQIELIKDEWVDEHNNKNNNHNYSPNNKQVNEHTNSEP